MLWNKCDAEVNIGGISITILLPVVNNDAFTEGWSGGWSAGGGGGVGVREHETWDCSGNSWFKTEQVRNKSGNEINLQ